MRQAVRWRVDQTDAQERARSPDRLGEKVNPYEIALKFGLERIHRDLQARQHADRSTNVVVESRGRKEDNELELVFRRVCDGGNYRSERLDLSVVFASKQINSSGLQIADLVARPIGRKILKPDQPNRAYDILEAK